MNLSKYGDIAIANAFTEETVNGVDYYKLGTIYYRPYLAGDDEIFVVSKI